MVTNPEKLGSGLDSELLDIQKDTKNWLWALKEKIFRKSGSGSTEVKEDNGTKTEVFEYKGAIVFNYNQKSGEKRQILTRKEGNTYKVRVKKWAQFPNGEDWQTQKFDGKETFDFEASNREQFNVKLGKALDQKIKNRQKLPNTGKTVYDMLNSREQDESPKKTNIKKKPIDLHFEEKNPEKTPSAKLPDRETVEGRVLRCLRWTEITNAVEDRYGIPRGLLLPMAAQESYGDPTVTNAGGDGGAGLLHIQGAYAKMYGLKVEKISNSGPIDHNHGQALDNLREEHNNDLKVLSEHDERFNILEAVDVSARFLIGEYVNKNKKLPEKNDTEGWLKVASRYNSPKNTTNNRPTGYGKKILYYWTVMNEIRGLGTKQITSGLKNQELKDIANGKTKFNVNGDSNKNNIHTVTEDTRKTREALNQMEQKIDKVGVSIDDYYKYWGKQCENYGLQEYVNYDKEHPYVK